MYTNFIIEENTKTFEELFADGLTFAQINKALKEQTKNTKTFQDFLDGMPALHCMFKEYLEDELSGMITDLDDFQIAFDNYFDFIWGLARTEIDNGTTTFEETQEDLETLAKYSWLNYEIIAEYLNL